MMKRCVAINVNHIKLRVVLKQQPHTRKRMVTSRYCSIEWGTLTAILAVD
jgi:hypothetical protein